MNMKRDRSPKIIWYKPLFKGAMFVGSTPFKNITKKSKSKKSNVNMQILK